MYPTNSWFHGSVSHSLPLSLLVILHISVASLLSSFILLSSVLNPDLANEGVCLSLSLSTGGAQLVVEHIRWLCLGAHTLAFTKQPSAYSGTECYHG